MAPTRLLCAPQPGCEDDLRQDDIHLDVHPRPRVHEHLHTETRTGLRQRQRHGLAEPLAKSSAHRQVGLAAGERIGRTDPQRSATDSVEYLRWHWNTKRHSSVAQTNCSPQPARSCKAFAGPRGERFAVSDNVMRRNERSNHPTWSINFASPRGAFAGTARCGPCTCATLPHCLHAALSLWRTRIARRNETNH